MAWNFVWGGLSPPKLLHGDGTVSTSQLMLPKLRVPAVNKTDPEKYR